MSASPAELQALAATAYQVAAQCDCCTYEVYCSTAVPRLKPRPLTGWLQAVLAACLEFEPGSERADIEASFCVALGEARVGEAISITRG